MGHEKLHGDVSSWLADGHRAAVFADAEASTNVPPPVCTSAPHVFSFTMDFAGSPSNAVEIAFGVDADADGTNGLVNMSKHGHVVSRSTNNCVCVDGAIVHEGE